MQITIKDSQDTFVMNGNEVHLILVDETIKTTYKSELEAYMNLVAQMFYDHECSFQDEDDEQMKKMREMFDNALASFK